MKYHQLKFIVMVQTDIELLSGESEHPGYE
jgi:hypothetical protein